MPAKPGSIEIVPRFVAALLLFRVMTLLPGLLTVVPDWRQSARAGVAALVHKTAQAASRAAPRRPNLPVKLSVKKPPAPRLLHSFCKKENRSASRGCCQNLKAFLTLSPSRPARAG